MYFQILGHEKVIVLQFRMRLFNYELQHIDQNLGSKNLGMARYLVPLTADTFKSSKTPLFHNHYNLLREAKGAALLIWEIGRVSSHKYL